MARVGDSLILLTQSESLIADNLDPELLVIALILQKKELQLK
jgi:hypothetical protein